VSGHIVLGLDEVLLDLEGEGYSTRAFVIPASAVDANHKRERVWIVAYSNNTGDRTSQRKTDKDRQTHDEGQAEQPQSQSSRQSTDVANTDSRMRRGGRAIRSSGENKQRRIHTTQEKQTSHDIRSKTIGCDTVRGEAKDVANTQSFGSDGREHQHDTEENREKGAIGSKVRRESSTENVANSQDIRHEFSTYEEKQRGYTTRHSQGQLERDGADVPNTQGKGLEGQRIDRETSRDKESREFDAQSGKDREQYQQGSIERRLGGVVDGVPSWMDEPDIPRVTTNQAGRTQRLKMLGNAVVPQVVYQLGLAMKELWDEV
jgi:site-specific DNA-cytosine methylase